MAMRCHEHPLKEQEFSSGHCRLCGYSIYDRAYVCGTGTCEFHVHKLCRDAPPRIRHHPFHPLHDLCLVRDRKYGRFRCDAGCDFFLDVDVALSTLPDPDGSPQREQITVPLHGHGLNSFSAKWEIGIQCVLCHGRIEGDGYTCSLFGCGFLIHKRCAEDRDYEDGTKVPRVHHAHGLVISSKEGGSSSSIQCLDCESDILSGEYLGCVECEYFYHRSCVQLPEVLRFPTHPDHTLVLFVYTRNYGTVECRSCSRSIRDCLSYRCVDCDFALHTTCALRTLSYCEKGASVEMSVPWHEHPVLLCHRTDDADCCSGCGDNVKGLAYRCKERNCELLLDKACLELRSEIDHPYHPDTEHPLVLLTEVNESRYCDACWEDIVGFRFSCKPCEFNLDVKCASQVPTRKSHLHEHKLARFDEASSLECNRCGTNTDSPLFRCVPCDFNLHEKCMELPPTAKHKIDEHDLVLWESYMEDDEGDYYCDICEKERDERLGVYVCARCKRSILTRAHIQCVLPELQDLFKRKGRDRFAERLDEEVTFRDEEVRELEKKLEEAKAKLDKARKKREERSSLKANGKA